MAFFRHLGVNLQNCSCDEQAYATVQFLDFFDLAGNSTFLSRISERILTAPVLRILTASVLRILRCLTSMRSVGSLRDAPRLGEGPSFGGA